LVANAKDSRNDVFITSSILFALFIQYYFNLRIDTYLAIIIALRLFMDAPWLNIVTIGVYFVVGWPVLKSFVSGLSRKQF
ncbi:hypothetical protein PT069_09450, partial [Erysipelothrix rhusiopathiae]|nr:hypothetical protein [Erysipelothrix rhusiopathiae]